MKSFFYCVTLKEHSARETLTHATLQQLNNMLEQCQCWFICNIHCEQCKYYILQQWNIRILLTFIFFLTQVMDLVILERDCIKMKSFLTALFSTSSLFWTQTNVAEGFKSWSEYWLISIFRCWCFTRLRNSDLIKLILTSHRIYILGHQVKCPVLAGL